MEMDPNMLVDIQMDHIMELEPTHILMEYIGKENGKMIKG